MDFSSLHGPGKFEIEGEASIIASAWETWVEEFEAYADCLGATNDVGTSAEKVKNRARRRALLLYHAGPRVREVFKSLNAAKDTPVEEADFKGSVDMLNAHYLVKPNITYLRHMFRNMSQESGETLAKFVGRLRKASSGCNFHDVNDMIKDQVVSNCCDDRLRRKYLEQGDKLDLNEALSIAASFEAVEQQSKDMNLSSSISVGPNVNRLGANNYDDSNRGTSNSHVGSQYANTRPKGKFSSRKTGPVTDKCTSCGRRNHKSGDSRCPARDKECHNCKRLHHFESQCWSKGNNSSEARGSSSLSTRGKNVNCLETEESCTEEGKGAFACKTHANFRFDKVVINVGGVNLDVLVDSGSECNIISIDTWHRLESLGIRADIRDSDIKLFPYTVTKPLTVHACFNAEIIAGDNSTSADFIIISDIGQPSLLGLNTARELGVLKIGINLEVNKVNQCKYAGLLANYSDLFSGIGKYRGAQVKIAVNPDVTPVAQPFRRIPYALREKVEAKLKSLEEQDII